MIFQQLLAELPKLTPEQRGLLRVRLAQLEGEDWIDDSESPPAAIKLIEERMAEYQRGPSAGIRVEEVAKRLRARLGY